MKSSKGQHVTCSLFTPCNDACSLIVMQSEKKYKHEQTSFIKVSVKVKVCSINVWGQTRLKTIGFPSTYLAPKNNNKQFDSQRLNILQVRKW